MFLNKTVSPWDSMSIFFSNFHLVYWSMTFMLNNRDHPPIIGCVHICGYSSLKFKEMSLSRYIFDGSQTDFYRHQIALELKRKQQGSCIHTGLQTCQVWSSSNLLLEDFAHSYIQMTCHKINSHGSSTWATYIPRYLTTLFHSKYA